MPYRKLRFRIQLNDIQPSIWRRFETPAELTFADLHLAIQGAMGWYNAHLHEFRIGDTVIGRQFEEDFPDEEETLDHEQVRVQDYLSQEGQTAQYLYDFGDSWSHQLTLETIFEGKDDAYRVLEGEGACPPEDCGGYPGYMHLLEVLQDPQHPDYESLSEWLAEVQQRPNFDPRFFSVSAAQSHLETVFRPVPPTVDQFGGIPRSELYTLIQQPFGQDSPLQVNRNFSPDLLAKVPFFQLTLGLMGLIDRSGGLKATAAAGNLPRKAVQELYNLRWFPDQWVDEGKRKLNREDDFSQLFALRHCLTMAKLIRKSKGKFVLTKAGKQLYEAPPKHSELFTLLGEAYGTRFSLPFFDMYPDEHYGQWGIGFSLLLLKAFGQQTQSADWYHRHYRPFFVSLMGEPEMRTSSYLDVDPIRESTRMYLVRFLKRYAERLGLVTLTGAAPKPKQVITEPTDINVEATELLEAWIGGALPAPEAWQEAVGQWWGGA